MKFSFLLLLGLLFGMGAGCSKDETEPVVIVAEPPTPSTGFAYGADPSWMTQMEASNYKFYNSSGAAQDLLAVLRGKGIEAIRLRVWVNPANGWCNTADLLVKARRAKAAGMRLLVDFHYSDSWADPGQQTKPAGWAGQNASALAQSVYDHTLTTLTTLKAAGVPVEWVQIGNEISDGMLWPEGRPSLSAANFQNLAAMINSGQRATAEVYPAAKVIVHVANGQNLTNARWIFDGLRAQGARWDVCGLSVYPTATNWPALNQQVLATMQDVVSRYGKEVMICEAGMSVADAIPCREFLRDLIAKTQAAPGGLGVFYWEPQAYSNWQGYTLGAFDSNGRPTAAMDAFVH
ncbi:glycoside hydrolase family 53 protein [Hymenobacter sediminicola]|uniref:Arabinogalactan endo-beta-1,4-galactanase n=1 Tax=Hymenobacter sediminicola TaxID=2761579 RepID=A0A7G7W8C7_9BACT|nr:glycosyl hydrolase 53 family protein [Hymenobacter sediminicola]QNH62620.1 glycosyl hydrolase 53 family protein [Hymenobacter sediminicola]